MKSQVYPEAGRQRVSFTEPRFSLDGVMFSDRHHGSGLLQSYGRKDKFNSKLRQDAVLPVVSGDHLDSASTHEHVLEALCDSGHQ